MNKYVYHGSPNGGLTTLKPHKSTHMVEYVYATINPAIALIFAIEDHSDLYFDLRVREGKIIFTERRKDVLEIYNKPGYLYTLNAENFKQLDNLWSEEVVSDKDETVLSCEYIPNILKKLEEYVKEGKMIIYKYPDKPDFIPKDDSDLVEEYVNLELSGFEGAADRLVELFPHLKEKVFNRLKMPEEFYYIDSEKDHFDSIIASDTEFHALFRLDSSIFIRDEGWLNYVIEDEKVNFSRGGFNLDEVFYVYKVKGQAERKSASSFKLDNVEIISREIIDLRSYISEKTKTKN